MVQAASERNYIGGRKVYFSLELGWEMWKLAFSSGLGGEVWQASVRARDSGIVIEGTPDSAGFAPPSYKSGIPRPRASE